MSKCRNIIFATEPHVAGIIALVCTSSPDGSKRWSLTLLAEELRKKEGFETISKESIRIILKKAKLSSGKDGCVAFRRLIQNIET